VNDLYLLRNKQTGKYFRKLPTLGGVMARCDTDLNVQTLQSLFLFETPEAAFQFLRTGGAPLPKDTEVVPFAITPGKPIKILDVHPHVSVAMPQEGQMVLANPRATKEEIKAAFASQIVTPDPDHDPNCTCKGFYQPPDCPVHGR
jgi:hypothetical protein